MISQRTMQEILRVLHTELEAEQILRILKKLDVLTDGNELSIKAPNTTFFKEGDAYGFRVELSYPRLDQHTDRIYVGLEDVRAADDIRVTFDFERDGWKIAQQEGIEFNDEYSVALPSWKEVAFIQAWGSYREPTAEEESSEGPQGSQ